MGHIGKACLLACMVRSELKRATCCSDGIRSGTSTFWLYAVVTRNHYRVCRANEVSFCAGRRAYALLM